MSAKQQSGSVYEIDPQGSRARFLARGVRRRAAARQPAGIILLVVLVLLALFTMLLISFVVATVSNRQSVIQSARVEQTGDSPQSQLYDAFMQVVRGPRDSNSVIGPHSLLEDIYGHNAGVLTVAPSQYGIRGQISAYKNPSNAYLQNGGNNTPLLQFVCTTTDFNVGSYFNSVNDIPYGFYSGLVITMVNGPAAGRSSRITGYYFDPTGSPNYSYFQVLAFDGATPNPGDTFLINGRPFSGTGFGYRPVAFAQQAYPPSGALAANASYSRLLDAFDPGTLIPGASPGYDPTNFDPTNSTDLTTQALNSGAVFQYALLPNPRRGVFQPFTHTGNPNPGWSYLDPAGPGGANEDYDAPDFQNMLLAMRIWADPSQTGPPFPNGKYHLVTPLPSLHRPDLLLYWNNRWNSSSTLGNGHYLFPSSALSAPGGTIYDAITSNGANNYFTARNLLRKITLRPLAIQDDPSTPNVDESENPYFTGSNPVFDPINGPWDVDNDGDGTPDSIWVDVGFPVQTGPDGRRYKPLAAILCLDMDGKLNLNAHSSWAHVPSATTPGLSRFNPVIAPFAQVSDTTPSGAYLKIGSGYGPPEISLHSLFEPGLDLPGAPFIPTGELYNLLGGNLTSATKIEGRYGELGISSALAGAPYNSSAGPGVSLVDEPFNWLDELGYPQISNLGGFPEHQNLYLPMTSSFGNFTINASAFSGNIWTTRSAFGSPPDLDGDGMIGLDLRGQPLYIDYPQVYGVNNGLSGIATDTGWGERDETIDDPYELDLSYNARNDGYSATLAFSTFASNLLAINGSTNSVVSIDAPFTAAELEQILRWNDADAPSLPDRLRLLAPNAFTNSAPTLKTASNTYTGRYPYYPELAQMRNLVTTHSFDVPAPSMLFTAPEHALELQTNRFAGYGAPPISGGHLSQLLAARIYRDNGGPPSNVNVAISQLLPPDLIAGEKMNINRPFGNGVDDNQNNVVDEVGEYEQWWGAVYNGTAVQFDVNNDGVADGYSPSGGSYSDANTDGVVDWRDGGPNSASHGDMNGDGTVNALDAWASPPARQLLARHLYVLMMLLKDDNYVVNADINGDGYPPTGTNATPGNAQAAIDVAYYMAQWAVNVVDFRDSDAIMTPFEFDIYPFRDDDPSATPSMPGTWDVDGVLTSTNIGAALTSNDDTATYRGLVWGAERPELLITETSATHDRRTRDTDKDNGIKKYRTDSTNPDPTFDQVRRPQGSLFVELYNPNSPVAIANEIGGRAPNELYTAAGTDPVSGAPMFGLNLAMRAPPKPGSTVAGAPVWRLAILNQSAFANLNMPARQVVLPYNATSGTPNITPITPNPNIPATPAQVPAGIPVIDRVAYFTSQPLDATGALNVPSPATGTLDVEPWRQFYPQIVGTNKPETYAIIPPNHYAVVGSASPLPDLYVSNTASPPWAGAISTPLGNRDQSLDNGSNDPSYPLTYIQDRYNFRIVFTPNVYVYNDVAGQNVGHYGPPIASSTYSVVKPAIGIPMAPLLFSTTSLVGTYTSSGALNYSAASRSTRFSITEPSAGYPFTTATNATVKTAGGASVPSYDENAYYDPTLWTVGAAQGFPDLPYDQDATYFLANGNAQFPNTYDQNRPSFLAGANADSTTTGKTPPTVVYLQRLANPLLPWDANANPYIIVDHMAVDLTMYNSEKSTNPSGGGTTVEKLNNPTTGNLATVSGTTWSFDSRQRSGNPANTPTNPDYSFNNIWYPFGWFHPGANSISNFMTNSSWGCLNSFYGYMNTILGGKTLGPMWNGANGTPAPPLQVNSQPTGQTLTNQQADYLGDPTLPFPWFNWNDRPYVSSKELMLVPVGSSASMLAEMTVGTPAQWPGVVSVPTTAVPSYDPNDPNLGSMAPIQSPYEPTALSTQQPLPKGEFGHLPNMFLSPHYTGATRTLPSSANFYRLLDFVHVPSRFTGTENWLTPTVMQGNSNVAGVPVHQLHPPFNRISRFRDPGRVNLNTIFDPFIWQGIMDEGKAPQVGTPPWLYLWQMMCNSRLGTGNTAYDVSGVYLNTSMTSLLGAAPVSPSIFGVPFRSSSGHTLVPLNAMRTVPSGGEREVDGTMLRASLVNNAYPLFEYPGPALHQWTENGPYTDPYTGVAGIPAAHDNPNRNPYFAYKAMRRLDNLLTTRSNVYAVWITLGYFEVTPAPSSDPQRAVKYPDGWVLGQEVGADTGDIKRHRAFFMYDRSIPVGFERGENHNVHKGILLERYIE
ncbi:MAG TPA: hypothetical protein VHD36_15965 [Pirellulales bacterium]|nr:hypothetical protein [Pirellulales bacterium]